MPEIGDDENDLPYRTTGRDDNSCLPCQILFSDALDGLRLCIPRKTGV